MRHFSSVIVMLCLSACNTKTTQRHDVSSDGTIEKLLAIQQSSAPLPASSAEIIPVQETKLYLHLGDTCTRTIQCEGDLSCRALKCVPHQIYKPSAITRSPICQDRNHPCDINSLYDQFQQIGEDASNLYNEGWPAPGKLRRVFVQGTIVSIDNTYSDPVHTIGTQNVYLGTSAKDDIEIGINVRQPTNWLQGRAKISHMGVVNLVCQDSTSFPTALFDCEELGVERPQATDCLKNQTVSDWCPGMDSENETCASAFHNFRRTHCQGVQGDGNLQFVNLYQYCSECR